MFTLYKEIPFPYNLFTIIGIPCIVILFNHFYNPQWLEPYRKKITISAEIVLVLLVIISITVFLYNTYHIHQPPKDKFVVCISPFNLDKSKVDFNTAEEMKKKLENSSEGRIKARVLDPPPITGTEEAISTGKKVGAHFIIYGVQKEEIGDQIEIEFHIIPTNSEAIPSQSTGLNITDSSKLKAKFSPYTTNSILVVESLTENVSSTVYTICALKYYERSDYISAINMFKSIKNYEKESIILYYIANCYFYESEFNESSLYFNKAIELDPKFLETWSNKEVSLTNLGSYDKSIRSFYETLIINSENSDVWNGRGVYLGNLGKYQEALEAFNKAIEINPYNSEAWRGKGITLGNLGNYEEALKTCDKAIEINKQDSDAWYLKGVLWGKLDDDSEALKSFNEAIEINQQDSDSWSAKGSALNNLGNYEESIKACNKAIEINPQNSQAWGTKGSALGRLGKYEESIKASDKAIELDPNNSMYWNNKGGSLQFSGDPEEALEAFNKAIELDPQNELALRNKKVLTGYLEKY